MKKNWFIYHPFFTLTLFIITLSTVFATADRTGLSLAFHSQPTMEFLFNLFFTFFYAILLMIPAICVFYMICCTYHCLRIIYIFTKSLFYNKEILKNFQDPFMDTEFSLGFMAISLIIVILFESIL